MWFSRRIALKLALPRYLAQYGGKAVRIPQMSCARNPNLLQTLMEKQEIWCSATTNQHCTSGGATSYRRNTQCRAFCMEVLENINAEPWATQALNVDAIAFIVMMLGLASMGSVIMNMHRNRGRLLRR
jgi:hypothetical protein